MEWCQKCYNSGRIGNDSVVQYCDCIHGQKFRSANYRLLFKEAGLPDALIELTLEDFWVDKDYRNGAPLAPAQISLKRYAKEVVVEYERKIDKVLQRGDIFLPIKDDSKSKYRGNNLFFYGGDESGKTMLAVHILKRAVYKAETSGAAHYVIWDDLLAQLSPWDDWEPAVYNCRKCGILCIDSIDSVGGSRTKHGGHIYTRLNMILKHRMLNKKPTIITSSYSPHAFKQGILKVFYPLIKRSLCIKLDDNYQVNLDEGGR